MLTIDLVLIFVGGAPPFGREVLGDSNRSHLVKSLIVKPTRRLQGRSKTSKRKHRRRFIENSKILNDNVVYNLSDYKLNLNELKVLNKGLGFVPSHFIPKYCDIDNNIKRFERKLQLHFFFAQKDLVQLPEKNVLQKNSNWWPKKLNGHITKFCYDIKHLILEGFKHTGRSNLPPKEISALKSLSSNRSIVVKNVIREKV